MLNLSPPKFTRTAEHSTYSPSGSSRWVKCPGSILAESQIEIENTTNWFAEEGTAAHLLGAHALEKGISPEMYIGRKYNDFTVDKEMARHVDTYYEYVNNKVLHDCNLMIETAFDLYAIEDSMFGTIDAVILSPDFVEIIDLKYGKGIVVEVIDNYQLRVYALSVMMYLAENGHRFPDDFEITTTIVQPRAPHTDGPIRSDVITIAELREFKKEVKEAIRLSKLSEPPLCAGESQCRWCRAAPRCSTYAMWTLEMAQLDFEEFFAEPTIPQKRVEFLNDEQIAHIVLNAKAFENWIKSVKEYASSQWFQGNHINHLKMVAGRSNRTWDPTKEEKRNELFKELELKNEDLYAKPKIRTPTQLQKLVTNEDWEAINQFVIKPMGKPTLVPITDNRPEYKQNSIENDFAEHVDV